MTDQRIEFENQELQRLKKELHDAQDEIYDLHTEFQEERETMLDDIRHLGKEMSLYKKIVERLIPFETLEPLLQDAVCIFYSFGLNTLKNK